MSRHPPQQPENRRDARPAPGARERAILALLKERSLAGASPPTVREIAGALGIRSTGSVAAALRSLEAAGLLRRAPGLSRGVSLTRPPRGEPGTASVPVLPLPPDGVPFEHGSPTGHLRLDRTLFPGRSLAAVRVPAGRPGGGRLPVVHLVLKPGLPPAGGMVVLVVDGSVLAGPLHRGSGRWRVLDLLSGDEVVLDPATGEPRVLGVLVGMVTTWPDT